MSSLQANSFKSDKSNSTVCDNTTTNLYESTIIEKHIEFYNNIMKTKKVWHCTKPETHHYFIDKNKICGIQQSINSICNDKFLSKNFKNHHLRVINISPKIYKAYHQLTVSTWKNCSNISSLSCVDKMKIMKDIGNEIFKNGDLNASACYLFIGGVQQLGFDQKAEHKHCSKDNVHNLILSQLYNNISVIYYIEKSLEKSAHYAKKALFWNPKYGKVIARLKNIENQSKLKMNLND